MKLNFQKQSFDSLRLIGFAEKVTDDVLIAKLQANLTKILIQNNDLHSTFNKYFFEIVDGQLIGPYIGVIGQRSKVPTDLNVLEFQKINWFSSNLENFELDAQSLLKLSHLFPKIREKIPFKNVFLSLEFDKIELHFFEV